MDESQMHYAKSVSVNLLKITTPPLAFLDFFPLTVHFFHEILMPQIHCLLCWGPLENLDQCNILRFLHLPRTSFYLLGDSIALTTPLRIHGLSEGSKFMDLYAILEKEKLSNHRKGLWLPG